MGNRLVIWRVYYSQEVIASEKGVLRDHVAIETADLLIYRVDPLRVGMKTPPSLRGQGTE
jgi:hypothetical protein